MYQIRLKDLVYSMLKHKTLIIVVTLIATLLGGGLAVLTYMSGHYSITYDIQSSVEITAARADGTYSQGGSSPSLSEFDMAREASSEVVVYMLSKDTIEETLQDMNLVGVSYQKISKALTIKLDADATTVANMTLTWANEDEGKAFLSHLTEVAEKHVQESMSIGELNIIDAPYTAKTNGGNKNITLVIYSLLIGLVLGCAISIYKFVMHPTVLDKDDIEDVLELETVGNVPYDKEYFERKNFLVSDMDDVRNAAIYETFGAIAQIVSNRLSKGSCFYIASTGQGEGRSVIASNIGIQLSLLGFKVLIVDADFRAPVQPGLLRVEVSHAASLNAIYSGEKSVNEAIISVMRNLSLLSARMEDKTAMIDDRLLRLLEPLKNEYDYVVVDTPAMGYVSDALRLDMIADGVLFVVCHDKVWLSAIEENVFKLKQTNSNILGCVANCFTNVNAAKYYESEHNKSRLSVMPFVSQHDKNIVKTEEKAKVRKPRKKKKE